MSIIEKKSVKRLIAAGCLIAGILLMPGCSEEVKVYADPAGTVEVNTNKEFIVTLDANPTTGYFWQASYDKGILKLVDKTYKQNNTRTPTVGVGGIDTFRFQALKAGSTEIQFAYKRPWESEIGKQVTFKVMVK
jgi:inhibitor of cysteine peptidase